MACLFSKEFMNASHFYSKKKDAKNAATAEKIAKNHTFLEGGFGLPQNGAF